MPSRRYRNQRQQQQQQQQQQRDGGELLSQFKMSIESYDPEIFVESLILAITALRMSPEIGLAEKIVPTLSNHLELALKHLNQCQHAIAVFKDMQKEGEIKSL